MQVENLGKISCFLGAGRIKKEDKIDYEVGIILNKKVGDYINKDEIIAYVYANDLKLGNEANEKIKDCFEITNNKVEKLESILGIIK